MAKFLLSKNLQVTAALGHLLSVAAVRINTCMVMPYTVDARTANVVTKRCDASIIVATIVNL